MRLDEAALRRPGFDLGEPIVLADGQAWTFPRPTFDILPRFDDACRVVGVDAVPRFGAEYERLLEAFESGDESKVAALMGLAAFLLRVNYDLGPDDLRGLLRLRDDDAMSQRTWLDIARVARGLDLARPDDEGDDPPKGPGPDTGGPAA